MFDLLSWTLFFTLLGAFKLTSHALKSQFSITIHKESCEKKLYLNTDVSWVLVLSNSNWINNVKVKKCKSVTRIRSSDLFEGEKRRGGVSVLTLWTIYEYDIKRKLAKISRLKFFKSPTVLSLLGIPLRTTFDIRHELAKISSLKFLESPALLSSLGISPRTTNDITHGLAKISSLKFLKSPAVLPSLGISLRTSYDIRHELSKISSPKFLKRPAVLSSLGKRRTTYKT